MEVLEEDGKVRLLLSGDLDIATFEKLTRALGEVEAREPGLIVLDLSNLDFIDSSGLRAIVAADAGARRDGHRVVVVEGPDAVRRVFRHTLLDKRLTLVEDADSIE